MGSAQQPEQLRGGRYSFEQQSLLRIAPPQGCVSPSGITAPCLSVLSWLMFHHCAGNPVELKISVHCVNICFVLESE